MSQNILERDQNCKGKKSVHTKDEIFVLFAEIHDEI